MNDNYANELTDIILNGQAGRRHETVMARLIGLTPDIVAYLHERRLIEVMTYFIMVLRSAACGDHIRRGTELRMIVEDLMRADNEGRIKDRDHAYKSVIEGWSWTSIQGVEK